MLKTGKAERRTRMRISLVGVGQSVPGFEDIWFEVIAKGYKKVLRPDTEVVQRGLKVGLGNPFDYTNHYYTHLNLGGIVEAFLEDERQGFDAGVVGCFDDWGIKEASAVVDIPLIGPGLSSMLFACQLGRKFAVIVANMPGIVPQIEQQVRAYGLEDRVIPDGIVTDIHDFGDTWTKGFEDPQFVANGVVEKSRELVSRGADVIVVGCCGIGPFCSAVGLHKIEVGNRNIPIVDAQMIALKTAEMAVDLRRGLGLPFTSLPRPANEDVARYNLGRR
jgi:Asp/Glu/hydantoin racemase